MHNGNIRKRKKEKYLKINNNRISYKLMLDTKQLIQESQSTPSRINSKITIPRHIILKFQELKKISKNDRSQREKTKKHCTCKKAKIRIKSDFASENMQARREWTEIFEVLREERKCKTPSVSCEITLCN